MSRLQNRPLALERAIFIAILALAIPMVPMLIVGVVPGSAFAQAVDIPAILSAALSGPPNAITLQYGHQFKTDVEDGGAEMSLDGVLFTAGHIFKLSEKTVLMLRGGYSLLAYDFGGNSSSFIDGTTYIAWTPVDSSATT